jgi:hypothetical protein
MIAEIIQHMNSILGGMPYFSENFGICELKPNAKGVTQPAQYVNGKWQAISLNKKGLTYWRKTGNVTIEDVESFSQCDVDYESTFNLRLFCMTKRSQFPSDDAYSGDRLAATILKGIALTGGALKRQINARHLAIRPNLYSTDTPSIINQEFAGIPQADFKHVDLVIAIDVNVIIIKRQPCIEDPCDYTPRFCLQLETKIALPE